MTAPSDPYVSALRTSHDTLASLVAALDAEGVEGPSYCSEWTIAQVLSHIGSGCEIFGLWLDAGLAGDEPPGHGAFPPVWDAWNARSPEAQARDAVESSRQLLERMEATSDEERERFHLDMFGMSLDFTGLVRMRLAEHAVHTWDVAVMADPQATVSADAVDLLVDTLGMVVARSGKPDGKAGAIDITTTAPARHFRVSIGEHVTWDVVSDGESAGDAATPAVTLPAEALVRAVYGRLDADHTPPFDGPIEAVARLRDIFPGM